jgi:hypothetical protein
MPSLPLSRSNKNQFRKYPFKQTSSLLSLNGTMLPDNIFVGASITVTYGRHRVYLKQFCYQNQKIHATIAAMTGNSEDSDEVLGVFTGDVTEGVVTLSLNPFVRFVSGSLSVSAPTELEGFSGISLFSREQSEFEESVVYCYTPPAVTSVRDKLGSELRGIVDFGVLTNIEKTSSPTAKLVQFTATSPASVFNPADKSSLLGNCKTPVIKNINGVVPFPLGVGNSQNDGNIYIVGVKPIVFYGVPGENGSVGVNTEGVTLDSLCTQKHKLLPPLDISGFTLDSLEYRDAYYNKSQLPKYPEDYQGSSPNYPLPRPERVASNFNSVKIPEYYFWPQFAKEDYYNNHKYWPQPEE